MKTVTFERINGTEASREMPFGSIQHKRFHRNPRWRQTAGEAPEEFGEASKEPEADDNAEEPAGADSTDELDAVAELHKTVSAMGVADIDQAIADSDDLDDALAEVTPKPDKVDAVVAALLGSND